MHLFCHNSVLIVPYHNILHHLRFNGISIRALFINVVADLVFKRLDTYKTLKLIFPCFWYATIWLMKHLSVSAICKWAFYEVNNQKTKRVKDLCDQKWRLWCLDVQIAYYPFDVRVLFTYQITHKNFVFRKK